MASMALRTRRTKHASDKPALTIVCAWCGAVRDGSTWRPSRERHSGPSISHGICPDCFRRQIARIELRN